MENLFSQLKYLNTSGVYALINDQDKTCYIGFSSNISQSLIRQLSKLSDKYIFNLLEIVTNKPELRIKAQNWIEYYSNLNYNIINKKRVSTWKLTIGVINDFRAHNDHNYLLMVSLRCRANMSVTVGVFEDPVSMNAFLDKYYINKKVAGIFYSNNQLTKEYLKIHG